VPSAFDLIAVLLVFTAVFGWLNHVVIRLPHTIGLLVMALGSSLLLIGIEVALPDIALYESLTRMLRRVDLRETVLNGMLAFLLFAGALHVNLGILRKRAWTVGLIATLGVVISTAVVGIGLWWLSGRRGATIPLPWPWCSAPSSARPTRWRC
jgi:CPA1 family monovalent cation:H+ antiporter